MRLNKKGFTLVELLVVIVILGIITGISIPLIRNIQASNEMRKYTTYMDSLKVSAKLYVDSYSEDLFGHSKSGCVIIKYSQLEEKGLLKDIALGDVSCKSEDTYVKVVRVDDKTSYSTSIGCGPVKNGAVDIETQLPEGGLLEIDTCGVNSDTIMSLISNPASSSSINFKKRNIVISAISNTGFHEDISLSYGFVKKSSKPSDEKTDPTSVLVNGWKKLEMNYIGGNEQKRRIEEGNAITLDSSVIKTPNNITGDYYLVIRIDSLKDLGGRNWTTDSNKGNYIYLGTYRLDNKKPVFGEGSTILSSSNSYNSLTPKLNINVTDVYSTSGSNHELRMCISYDNDTCIKSVSVIKNRSDGWITYDGSKTLGKIQNSYDGSTHTVYVTVGDAAGNYQTQTYSYKLATRYTLTYDSNGGVVCDPTSKSVTFDETSPKWGNLCSPTRDNYTFTGWNTKADGSGDTITKDTVATKSMKVYAQWRKNQVIFQFKSLSGETLTSSTTASDGTVYNWTKNSNNLIYRNVSLYRQKYYYDSTSIDLPDYNNTRFINIIKTGYHGVSGKEWICESGCKTSGQKFSHSSANVTLSNICDYKASDCTVTVKVNWTTSSYAITYTLNSGALPSGKTNPTSYTIESNDITLNNPTRKGYSFDGWTGTGLSSASTSVKIPKGSTGDRAYSANWTPVTYTITYNLDGGSLASGVTNPTSYTIESNAITLNNPTKAGYHFAGWTGTDLSSASTSVKISKGSTGNRAYTATWTPNVCTITYSPNGGSFGSHASETTQKCNYSSENCTNDMRNAAGGYYSATKTGYHPVSGREWIKAGGTTTFNQANGYKATDFCSDLVSGDKSVTLNVNWEVTSYTITYNLDGGSLASGAPTSYTYGVGATINGTPTKSGYAFNGWSTSSNLSSAAFSQTISTTTTGDKTFYAKWCQNCASVTNGSCTLTATTAGTCTYTTTCNTGYTLSSGSGTRSPVCTASTYTVTFNINGGKAWTSTTCPTSIYTFNSSTKACTKSVTYNGTYGSLPTPTRDGHSFDGWYTAANGGSKIETTTSVKITAAQTLYAKWTTTCSAGGDYNTSTGKCEYAATIKSYRCSAPAGETCQVVAGSGGNADELSCPSGYTHTDQGDSWINCCKRTCTGGGWHNGNYNSRVCFIWIDTPTCNNNSCCPSGYSNATPSTYECSNSNHSLNEETHICSYTP